MDTGNEKKRVARKYLRLLLGALVLWDLGIGIYAVFLAKHFQEFILFTPRVEPLFIRGVGMYWLFAAYLQFLGFRNPEKNVVAVQLSIIFRLSAAVIDFIEAFFLLERPFYFFHYLLMLFVLMNCLIAYLTARCLRKMDLKWIEL
ncbi:MAG: hypothetical protein GWN67_19970 [Phycisphaerae bacterium]|nr:hypothetical protein [Phycisphaerae bacterium]NIP54392.1 hypothetical protein [Phycisphaerae bacterium]NIS53251.1 hypothetical protein [Phycisphaerae bacterium]NIU10777.1 hypothetical protein [Phycisphaerae bacterium]NIU58572.1 hypothetical protein [Phycisphaerae bacterium]